MTKLLSGSRRTAADILNSEARVLLGVVIISLEGLENRLVGSDTELCRVGTEVTRAGA